MAVSRFAAASRSWKTKPPPPLGSGVQEIRLCRSEPNCRAPQQQRTRQQLKVQKTIHALHLSTFVAGVNLYFAVRRFSALANSPERPIADFYERSNCRPVRRCDRLRWKTEPARHVRYHRDPTTARRAPAMLGRLAIYFQQGGGGFAQGENEFCR